MVTPCDIQIKHKNACMTINAVPTLSNKTCVVSMGLQSRARTLTAVLILLSATSIAEETKKCYWCGPLAEQVHRSQRAPSCGHEMQETTCDSGYTHCAVVATSPPYLESRLCVKLYQDECYSLYCNSTKTWRMICPCQGNLCNGRNTDREINAFAFLTKIAGKNKRNKRSLIKLQKMTLINDNQEDIAVADDNETTQITTQSDALMEDNVEVTHQTTTAINEPDSINQEEIEKNIEDNSIVPKDKDLNEMHADQPVEEPVGIIETPANTQDDVKTIETKITESTEPTKATDEVIMITPTNAMISQETKNEDELVTMHVEGVKETQETTIMPIVTTMKPTSIEIELSVAQVKNANDNLPPPEALQQTVTTTKPPTTMGIIEMSTNDNQNIETTTHSMKGMKKSNGNKNVNNLLILFIGIILDNAL